VKRVEYCWKKPAHIEVRHISYCVLRIERGDLKTSVFPIYARIAAMLRLNTYYIERSVCRNILEKLGDELKKRGFELVYVSKTDHEEEVYRSGDYVVILIYRHCAIRTNLPRNEIAELIDAARFLRDFSGIM